MGTSKRRRSARSPPTASGSTTWSATSGSGPRIASTTTTTARQRMDRLGPAAPAVFVFCAAGPGTTIRGTSAPRITATGTFPTSGPVISGSGSAEDASYSVHSLPFYLLCFVHDTLKNFCGAGIPRMAKFAPPGTKFELYAGGTLDLAGRPVRSGQSLKPERPLIAVLCEAGPGTTIRGTSAPRAATGTPQQEHQRQPKQEPWLLGRQHACHAELAR